MTVADNVRSESDDSCSLCEDTSSRSSQSDAATVSTRIISGVEFQRERAPKQKQKQKQKKAAKPRPAPPKRDVTAPYRDPFSKKPRAKRAPPPAEVPKPRALLRRHLPAHVMEAGSAEGYNMELKQVAETQRRLESENKAVAADLAKVEAALADRMRQAEELLQAACAADGLAASEKRSILSNQHELKTLRKSMDVVGGHIRAKKAELDDVKASSCPARIKELEERARLLFAESTDLQKRLGTSELDENVAESRRVLREARLLLESKEDAAVNAEARLRSLVKKQCQMEHEKASLGNALIKGQAEVEALQDRLGEARRDLQEAAAVPPEMQRLRAEVQTTEAQKAAVDAKLEHAKQHYELSAAQMQSSLGDTQGRLERCKIKEVMQNEAFAAVTKELERLEQCLNDRKSSRLLYEGRLKEDMQATYEAERSELMESIEQSKADLLSRMDDARSDRNALQESLREKRKAHKEEHEKLVESCIDRHKALVLALPVPTPEQDPQGEKDKNLIKELSQQNHFLEQELQRLRANGMHQKSAVPVPGLSPSPNSTRDHLQEYGICTCRHYTPSPCTPVTRRRRVATV